MAKVVWKGWSTSWDQIEVPVTIVINPIRKIEKTFTAGEVKKSKKTKPSEKTRLRCN